MSPPTTIVITNNYSRPKIKRRRYFIFRAIIKDNEKTNPTRGERIFKVTNKASRFSRLIACQPVEKNCTKAEGYLKIA